MSQEHHERGGRLGANRQTGDRIRETAQQAEEKVAETASDLRDRGEELAEQMTDTVFSRVDEEKERLVGGMRAVAHALREGGQGLPDDQRTYGRFVERVADRVEGASRYLDHHDVEELTRDVTRIARDNTPAFLGGAFVLGLLGARFAKSSLERSHGGRLDRDQGAQRGRRSLRQPDDGSSWHSLAATDVDDSLEGGHARGN
jgi:hypothetical protein